MGSEWGEGAYSRPNSHKFLEQKRHSVHSLNSKNSYTLVTLEGQSVNLFLK